MATVEEIAADVFRICEFVPEFNLQFNHFLVRDEEPLLFHAGMRSMFPALEEAVARLIDPAELRHVAWSHFEADECGALNDWLRRAPKAQPVCTMVGKLVSVDDFALRPALGLGGDDVLVTGRYRFRLIPTPHLPHGWDAGVLFEETRRTLFCSDLFHQFGEVVAVTEGDLLGPTRQAMAQMREGPLAGYMPYTTRTQTILRDLADLRPEMLAVMHGSSYRGEAATLLKELGGVIQDGFAA